MKLLATLLTVLSILTVALGVGLLVDGLANAESALGSVLVVTGAGMWVTLTIAT